MPFYIDVNTLKIAPFYKKIKLTNIYFDCIIKINRFEGEQIIFIIEFAGIILLIIILGLSFRRYLISMNYLRTLVILEAWHKDASLQSMLHTYWLQSQRFLGLLIATTIITTSMFISTFVFFYNTIFPMSLTLFLTIYCFILFRNLQGRLRKLFTLHEENIFNMFREKRNTHI